MSICLLMGDTPARQSLHELLVALQLEVIVVGSCCAFRQLTSERTLAAVVCETKLVDGSWVDVLNTLTAADAPSFIVTSRLVDDRLWVDVLHRGGYDVLAQPFDRSEVARAIELARENHRRRARSLRTTAA